MLKKKLGIEAIERDKFLEIYFKIPSILIIPEGVKGVREYTFHGCEKLKKVEIPESVEVIGYAAFYNCRNATIILKKLRSFKIIPQTAFLRCKDVKEETGN